MSYISIIVPAFHLNTTDINEINKYCCSQFKTSKENFNLIEIKKDNYKDIINYGIIFNESNLSLQSIEQLIYERNCIQNLTDKAFESLQLTSKKINDLENIINSIKEGKYFKIKNEEEKNNNFIDIIKEKEKQQIKYCEKSLNKIKIEFKNMVEEIESMNIKTNNKKYIQKNIFVENEKIQIDKSIKYENKNEDEQNLNLCD